MRPFQFINGPWENSELPTIVTENPDGGDPRILCVLKRVHNPEALYDLCRLANDRIESAAPALPAPYTNGEAGFTEFVVADRPVVVRDLGGGHAVLLDVDTREPIGIRWPALPAGEVVEQYRLSHEIAPGAEWSPWSGWKDGVPPAAYEVSSQWAVQRRKLYTAPPSSAAIRDAALEEAGTLLIELSHGRLEGSVLLANAAAAILALRSQPTDNRWRDIDSCPSDGSPIWLAQMIGEKWLVEGREADGEWMRSSLAPKRPRKWMPRQIPPSPPAEGDRS